MGSKQQKFNLLSDSMGSNDGNFERLETSPQKMIKTITPSEDLIDNQDAQNLYSMANLEEQGPKDYSHSDRGSGMSVAENERKSWLSNGCIRIPDNNMMYETIKNKLVSSLSSSGFHAQVEAIYRNGYLSMMSRAKVQSFGVYLKAIQKKYNSDANVKYAWYGASKNEINGILSYGFGLQNSNGIYGHCIYLSAADHPVESMQTLAADEDGLRHMLLCRVILGNVEVVSPGSRQYCPTSEEFDSGVDDLLDPKKYIIWNATMNTHILPEFVVSFRTSSYCSGCQNILQPPRLPNSDWIPLAALISGLSTYLPTDVIQLLDKHHNDYKKQKITRHELIRRVRHIVGDKLLIAMIKSYREKIKASGSSSTAQAAARRN